MRTEKWIGLTLLMSAAAFLSPAGHAQEDACAEEYAKFCPSVEPGEGRVGRCLMEHEADLGETCLAKLKARPAQEDACAEERAKFCSSVEPGEGRVGRCLLEHEAELGETCLAKLKELGGRMVGFAKVCEADAKQFCSDAQAGGGRVGECLAEHRAELSADCAEVLPKE